jgi:hypothetical protein
MDNGMMNNPGELAKLAFQFGPFLFSVLFSISIPWILHGYIAKTKDKKQERVYLRFFQITLYFGIALVLASVIWWFKHFPYTYVFKGKINDIENYIDLRSDALFFKPTAITFAVAEDLVRNMEFMVFQDKPFIKGQEFRLYLKKGGGEKKPLRLTYESEKDTEFEIRYMGDKNIYEIVSLTPQKPAKLSNPELLSPNAVFGGYLYAEELKTESAAPLESGLAFLPQAQDSGRYIGLLQDERTDVGLKIKILNSLKSLPDNSFKQVAETSTQKEPMALTLLDLSRHSDKELAYVSNVLLSRLDVVTYLVSLLSATDQASHQKAETILFRIEKELAEKVFSRVPAENRTTWTRGLQEEVYSGKRTRVLYPTGSNTGDRYYIFVEWKPGTQVPECLAQQFAREILFTSLEKELASLKNQNSRWVYKEDKASALRFAEEILKCGASAQFASIKNFKK